MTYAIAKAARDQLDREWRAASAALNAIPGVGAGPMGLTPDHIRELSTYREAKAAYDLSFARLRAFNNKFLKLYAADIRADRRRREAAM
ncbi:MAG: hypothetical protein K2X76_01490 [Sphingomonas sp.]|nr:hypothetical protein [Sphingomonas sp.]